MKISPISPKMANGKFEMTSRKFEIPNHVLRSAKAWYSNGWANLGRNTGNTAITMVKASKSVSAVLREIQAGVKTPSSLPESFSF
jgi:hypothetical protein